MKFHMTIATIRLIRPFCLSKISSDMNIGLIFMRYKRINKQKIPRHFLLFCMVLIHIFKYVLFIFVDNDIMVKT